jgi:hypothetical protein
MHCHFVYLREINDLKNIFKKHKTAEHNGKQYAQIDTLSSLSGMSIA